MDCPDLFRQLRIGSGTGRRGAESMRTPFFGAFHALTVDDAGRVAGFALGFLLTLDVERMMDAIERAVPTPQAEVIVHGASGRQVLGQRAPLAAGAEQVHHAVDHLVHLET